MNYVGRFAPSPTGPLHAGSLVAALASWLDARAHQGQWLLRIEDVDTPRCVAGMAEFIVQQLAACGLYSDATAVYQSQRSALYQQALTTLLSVDRAYPCACTRRDLEAASLQSGQVRLRHSELIYPGTCRAGLRGRPARAWRLRVNHAPVCWLDRRLGAQQQDVNTAVGDFILKRADGCFAYQLAVVVDDAAQGITDVVRGADLVSTTARQIVLQRALGYATPRYLHTPLVLDANGDKLSKQTGAAAIDIERPLVALNQAAGVLGLTPQAGPVAAALNGWTQQWAELWLRSKKNAC